MPVDWKQTSQTFVTNESIKICFLLLLSKINILKRNSGYKSNDTLILNSHIRENS